MAGQMGGLAGTGMILGDGVPRGHHRPFVLVPHVVPGGETSRADRVAYVGWSRGSARIGKIRGCGTSDRDVKNTVTA